MKFVEIVKLPWAVAAGTAAPSLWGHGGFVPLVLQ
jgi:hypothetical protein